MHVYIYICMYVCMYVIMYIYIYCMSYTSTQVLVQLLCFFLSLHKYSNTVIKTVASWTCARSFLGPTSPKTLVFSSHFFVLLEVIWSAPGITRTFKHDWTSVVPFRWFLTSIFRKHSGKTAACWGNWEFGQHGDMCRNDDHLCDWGIHLMGHKKYKFPTTGRKTGERLGTQFFISFSGLTANKLRHYILIDYDYIITLFSN